MKSTTRLFAAANTATVNENSSTGGVQVLSNDSDLDDSFGAGEFTLVSVGTAVASDARPIPGASVTFLPTGQVTFNAAGLFEDLDTGDTRTVTIPYTMQDDSGATSSSSIVITVTGVNDTPTAKDDTGATNEDTAVSVSVLQTTMTLPIVTLTMVSPISRSSLSIQ